MAVFDFGANILRSIQAQDVLNEKKQSRLQQQTEWNAEMAFKERQAQLAQKQFEARQLQQQQQFAQNMAFKAQQDVAKNNTMYDLLPPDVQKEIPVEMLQTLPNGRQIVSNEVVDNVEQSLRRSETKRSHQANESIALGNLRARERANAISAQRLKAQKNKDGGLTNYDKSYNTALGALQQLKILETDDTHTDPSKASYGSWLKMKQEGTTAVYNALSSLGINENATINYKDGTKEKLLDFIRNYKSPSGEETKAQKYARYNEAIYELQNNDWIDKKGVEALKLWAEIGMR